MVHTDRQINILSLLYIKNYTLIKRIVLDPLKIICGKKIYLINLPFAGSVWIIISPVSLLYKNNIICLIIYSCYHSQLFLLSLNVILGVGTSPPNSLKPFMDQCKTNLVLKRKSNFFCWVGGYFKWSVEIPSPKIVRNLPLTCKKLYWKVESYWFSD